MTPKPLNPKDFPLLLSQVAPYYKAQFEKMVERVNETISQGELIAARMKDFSFTLGNVLDNYRSEISKTDREFSLWIYHRDIEFGAQYINASIKRANKLEDGPNKTRALAMLTELVPLLETFAWLKTRIVKKVSNAGASKPVYTPPKASKEAFGLIVKTLTDVTNKVKHDLAEFLYTNYVTAITRYMNESDEKLRKSFIASYPAVFRFLQNDKVNADVRDFVVRMRQAPNDIKLLPNWKEYVHSVSIKEADEIQEVFIAKNSNKLGKIVELKGNLSGEGKILHFFFKRGVFEGEILFNFDDGSSFSVRNKMVFKYSKGGRPFVQFPTTFHDVYLPGKQPMKMPSEKRMIQVFGVAK